MKTNVDSVYRIGNTHKVCQDYARHGEWGGMPFIAVSDGCSSSKDTDVGARLLVHSAINHIVGYFDRDYDTFGKYVVQYADSTCFKLALEASVLDATLLIARQFEDKVKIFAYGDGNIIIQKKDGSVELININFESGAPFYLSYRLDEKRQSQYEYAFPGALRVGDDRKVYHAVMEWEFDVADLKSITLASDGFDSFLNADNEPVKLDLEQVLGFKNTKGQFLDRRMDRYLKQLKAQEVDHYDDFSIATMLFTE